MPESNGTCRFSHNSPSWNGRGSRPFGVVAAGNIEVAGQITSEVITRGRTEIITDYGLYSGLRVGTIPKRRFIMDPDIKDMCGSVPSTLKPLYMFCNLALTPLLVSTPRKK